MSDKNNQNSAQKHILVISQCFYPEQFRINDMCCEWVKRGYKVTVLTGIPNYPQGKFYEGYGWSKKRRERWNGMDIIRIPLIPRGNNAIGLILNYFSFPVSGHFWTMFTKLKADYVFMFETSPMMQCKIGVWYARKKKVPLYLYMQDIWPETVEVITGIHSRAVIGPIQKMVDNIYKNCTDIFVTSPSFVNTVCKRNISRDKVHYWPQYAEDFYRPVLKEGVPEIPENDKFKVIFTGNIGYAQGLQILPKTAALLKNKNIQFIVVGDGRYKSQFEKEIAGVDEMFVIVPRQPAEKIPKLLAACDAAFLSFQDTELFKMTIPAKLQSYMACGMPIIASASGETDKIITDAECGICTPMGDANQLADAIYEMSIKNKDEINKMGKNAREYFLSHFEKQMLMDQIDGYFTG